ncbi:hypothetical protein GCM10009120_51060 [Sphingobacterium siyangense subsp. cladoniae]|uniref:hypothetical protein n=1 Tax=Sphingobacterium siyangense TaxID=459529 RepID=UPI0031F77014
MKSFKKILRLSGLGLLIVLASIGIGLGGGAPILSSKKKEDTIEINVKLVENNQDKTALSQLDNDNLDA